MSVGLVALGVSKRGRRGGGGKEEGWSCRSFRKGQNGIYVVEDA